MVGVKLVEDKGMYVPEILSSLSDDKIASICDSIIRAYGLVRGKMPDRGNQISAMMEKTSSSLYLHSNHGILFQALQYLLYPQEECSIIAISVGT